MNEKGFTMTEVLTSLLIFSVVVVPLTYSLFHILSDTASKRRFQAIMLGKGAMEETLAFKQFDKSPDNPPIKNFKIMRQVEGDTLKTITIKVLYQDKPLYELTTYSTATE